MSEIILHHYPESPFSEKIRALMGYKGQSYKGVVIPVIMPKPDFISLTGGYRKTPAIQIGADIYCDSAIICRVIDRMFPNNTIYPKEHEATMGAFVHWTDTFFFKVSVAMAFQPKALQNHELFSDQDAAAAFMADRAELRKGSTDLMIDISAAQPYWLMHMKRLDGQLAHGSFLFGDKPCIADFSTYHCIWFVYNSEVLRDLFEPFGNVLAWRERMAGFGNGDLSEITSTEALHIARDAEPQTKPKLSPTSTDDIALGETVEVMPIDYGLQPTRGALLLASLEELAVHREDPELGNLAVHFPRLGFQIRKV